MLLDVKLNLSVFLSLVETWSVLLLLVPPLLV